MQKCREKIVIIRFTSNAINEKPKRIYSSIFYMTVLKLVSNLYKYFKLVSYGLIEKQLVKEVEPVGPVNINKLIINIIYTAEQYYIYISLYT